jgi:hypothetical protein
MFMAKLSHESGGFARFLFTQPALDNRPFRRKFRRTTEESKRKN